MARVSFKKLGAVGAGFVGTQIINDAFDYLLYPIVIGFLGSVRGGVIMTILAIVLNYIMVIIYNRTKTDWLGLEWLRLKRDEKSDSFLGRVIRAGWWPAFVLLSWEDPFKAFVFVRGRMPAGSRFKTTDWLWFFGANFVGNLIWILMLSGAFEILKRIF